MAFNLARMCNARSRIPKTIQTLLIRPCSHPFTFQVKSYVRLALLSFSNLILWLIFLETVISINVGQDMFFYCEPIFFRVKIIQFSVTQANLVIAKRKRGKE